MGKEELLTTDEAARALSIPVRSLRRLVQQGLLKAARKENTRYWYSPKDLAACATALSADVTVVSATNLAARALVSANRAEEKLDQVLSFLGMSYDPLETTRVAMLEEHAVARRYLHMNLDILDANEVFVWSKRLLKMDRCYLALLAFELEEIDPWNTFLDAADRILAKYHPKVIETDRSMKMACGMLDHARRALVQNSYLVCRIRDGQQVAEAMFPEALRGEVNDIIQALL